MIRALSLFTICAFAWPVAAADSDYYVEYAGGASFTPNQRLVGEGATGSNYSGRVKSDTGFNVNAGIGTRIYEYFRSELEVSFRQNEVSQINVQPGPTRAEGHMYLLAVMVNGYFDYDLGVGVIPYVGAGVGWGQIQLDAKNTPNGGTLRMEGEDSVFVWSVMLGGAYPINEAVDVTLGYRYISTTKPDLNSSLTNVGAQRFEGEYDSHETMLGLRFNF